MGLGPLAFYQSWAVAMITRIITVKLQVILNNTEFNNLLRIG